MGSEPPLEFRAVRGVVSPSPKLSIQSFLSPS